jgi:hypothetical protein
MKNLIFIFLVFFLVGCGVLYGEKIIDQEKPFSKETIFEFNLDSEVEHNIILDVAYRQVGKRIEGEFSAELIDPNGEKKVKKFELRNRVKDGRYSKTIHYVEGKKLFTMNGIPGKYMLTVKEDVQSNIKGKNLELKIYRKE